MSLVTGTLGYPRIGANRELKKALESYWRGDVSESALREVNKSIGDRSVVDQDNAGIHLIGCGDQTLYDHVLDWTYRFGCIPDRFLGHADIKSGLDTYFAMARGVDGAPAQDMSKHIGTNYHHLVSTTRSLRTSEYVTWHSP
jgi:5-methyltetrahydropteroyltriglutamate--homocysteine methyltransferase